MWSRGSKSNSTRACRPSRARVKSSSPPAGASSAARLGIASSAVVPLLLGLGLGGLGRLDLGGERPWSARAAPASRRPGPAGSACRAASARRAWPRSRRSPARRAASAASARSTTSSDSPRLAWAARTRSGSSRRMRGSIMGRGYPGRPSARAREIRRLRACADGILRAGVLDRPRAIVLSWAALCFVAVRRCSRSPSSPDGRWLVDIDDRGESARGLGRPTSPGCTTCCGSSRSPSARSR